MLRTALCDLLGIEVPIVQAGMGPWASAEWAWRSSQEWAGRPGRLSRTTNRSCSGRSTCRIRSLGGGRRATSDGIGSLGAGTRAAADLEGQLTRLRRLTDRPFAGQTVGLIREILPAAEIVRRIVAEAEAALQRAVKHIG